MRSGIFAAALHIPPPGFALADATGTGNNPPPASLSWDLGLFYAPRGTGSQDLNGRSIREVLNLAYPSGAEFTISRGDTGEEWTARLMPSTDPFGSNTMRVGVALPDGAYPAPAGTRWIFTLTQEA